jgi:hypothetical protein
MKTADQMTLEEFRSLLAEVTAPPKVTPMPRGTYQRKVKPTAAQQPFWNKRKKGVNKRPKRRPASRT